MLRSSLRTTSLSGFLACTEEKLEHSMGREERSSIQENDQTVAHDPACTGSPNVRLVKRL